jgi:hypothetical protein
MTLPGTGSSQSALLTGNASVGDNAPGSAALSATNTGAGSNNAANIGNSTKANVDLKSTGTITNNVHVNAQSGDASAQQNTEVGNVATGTAQANSSVANLFNTVLNVKHWFGVLVINVFGDWMGDVNNDTAAGGYSTAAGQGAGSGAAGQPSAAATASAAKSGGSGMPPVGLLALVSPAASTYANESDTPAAGTISSTNNEHGQVLTAAAESTPTATAAANQARNMSFLFIISTLVMLVAGALMTIDKKLRR